MNFSPPLTQAVFLRRYKRFLADIQLPSGEVATIHCPNTGSMLNCCVENSHCWFSVSDNPKRKYPYTWEIATTPGGYLAGINTGKANHLIKEAIENGIISELQHYPYCGAEVKYGEENSRIDFLLSGGSQPDCYVEVKSVTLHMRKKDHSIIGVDKGVGLFPDSVSARGTKHLRELMLMVKAGYRAVLVFCVQHTGIQSVSPADNIDPLYGETLRQAITMGVEVLAYGVSVHPSEIIVDKKIAVTISR